jgi:hypothetical protein
MHEVEEIEVSHEGAPIVKAPKCRPWHFEDGIAAIDSPHFGADNQGQELHRRDEAGMRDILPGSGRVACHPGSSQLRAWPRQPAEGCGSSVDSGCGPGIVSPPAASGHPPASDRFRIGLPRSEPYRD